MQTFSAVRTTGIYCRPGCGANPRPENVTTYALAAAAEAAGYRACLRCRPYRSPQSVAWTGPELVCRGVAMILDGALDGQTEARLGVRLGVSARHLRRLFLAHLGVTPAGLARSARAHFARRLLDDTDLSVTEIAFASGFGSLRQFNRVCQEVFRASPSSLRARRRVLDRLLADGGLALRLPFDGPLDWDALLAHLAARAIPGVEAVAGDTYRRTIELDDDAGVLELGPGGDDHLVLRAHLPHWEELIHVVERARRIASLDVDLAEPRRALSTDPTIGPLLASRPGVRVPGTWDPLETGVSAIVGRNAAGRLVERLGRPVPGLAALGLTHAFPRAEVLATADLDLPRASAASVRAFAQAVADDSIRLDRSVSLDRLVASMTALDGLGPRTAHYVALRLGEPDACPLDLPPAERWRPWRALATAHLWAAEAAEPAPVAA